MSHEKKRGHRFDIMITATKKDKDGVDREHMVPFEPDKQGMEQGFNVYPDPKRVTPQPLLDPGTVQGFSATWQRQGDHRASGAAEAMEAIIKQLAQAEEFERRLLAYLGDDGQWVVLLPDEWKVLLSGWELFNGKERSAAGQEAAQSHLKRWIDEHHAAWIEVMPALGIEQMLDGTWGRIMEQRRDVCLESLNTDAAAFMAQHKKDDEDEASST